MRAKIFSAAVTAAAVLMTSVSTVLMPAASAATPAVDMISYNASLRDKHSLQRGARIFVNYCISCHSARYMRYSRMAADLEIPPELVERSMMFTAERIGDPMVAVMSAQDSEKWFGIAAPDLSLVARLRGDEWLYNYFLSFYLDENSPSGWNNTVYPNVAMPHALHALQGLQRASGVDANGATRFEKISDGSMTETEYARAVGDLTNFLVYVGEPSRATRLRYGVWTMFFLLVFIALSYQLKKEYWRDIDA